MPADPDSRVFTPGPADLTLTGQAVALVHDGATGGGISDFKGKSRWRAVPDGFEVYVEERLGNAESREPAVIDVLASRLGADPIRRQKDSDAKDHGDSGEDGALRFPGGSELKVQIVSATVDQTFWRWANRLDSKAAVRVDAPVRCLDCRCGPEQARYPANGPANDDFGIGRSARCISG